MARILNKFIETTGCLYRHLGAAVAIATVNGLLFGYGFDGSVRVLDGELGGFRALLALTTLIVGTAGVAYSIGTSVKRSHGDVSLSALIGAAYMMDGAFALGFVHGVPSTTRPWTVVTLVEATILLSYGWVGYILARSSRHSVCPPIDERSVVDLLPHSNAPSGRPARPKHSMWWNGSYLLTLVVTVTGCIVYVARNTSGAVTLYALLTMVAMVALIGTIGLRHDNKLSEAVFLAVIRRTLDGVLSLRGRTPRPDRTEEK